MSAPAAIAEEDPRLPENAALIAALDARMLALYPAESCHLASPDELVRRGACFLVARIDGVAAGCMACIPEPDGAAEVKRVWTSPTARGRGVARALIDAIEERARAIGVRVLRLETGHRQPEALALFRRAGFVERGPFGCYTDDPELIFMEKRLDAGPLAIAEDDPRTPECAAMFDALDAEVAALYGDALEPQHLLGPQALVERGGVFMTARRDGRAIACGAIVPLGDGTAELKRMWTARDARGQGAARAVLAALEARARADGYAAILLECGPRQPAALSLYRSVGFADVPPFDGRPPDTQSVFMQKPLAEAGREPAAGESAA